MSVNLWISLLGIVLHIATQMLCILTMCESENIYKSDVAQ